MKPQPSEGNKHQMPNLAQRKFMRMVFKNRTDVSPLNPLAALFLCLSQVPALRDYFLSDAYKAQLKPEKNKSAGGADSVHAAAASMGDLNISGEWDAQDVYHGSRRLSLAQHFALCGTRTAARAHDDDCELTHVTLGCANSQGAAGQDTE